MTPVGEWKRAPASGTVLLSQPAAGARRTKSQSSFVKLVSSSIIAQFPASLLPTCRFRVRCPVVLVSYPFTSEDEGSIEVAEIHRYKILWQLSTPGVISLLATDMSEHQPNFAPLATSRLKGSSRDSSSLPVSALYLIHGFRWPRFLVRIHVIENDLQDAA